MTAGVVDQKIIHAAASSAAGLRAAVSLFDDHGKAMWQDCEQRLVATPYQTTSFAFPWLSSQSARAREKVRLITVHDVQGRIILLLPIILRKLGIWQVAQPIAGSHANFMAPLFDAQACTSLGAAQISAALDDGLFKAGADLAILPHVPAAWCGRANPLGGLTDRVSVNLARQAMLSTDVSATLHSLRSKDSLRKIAGKRRKLAAQGNLQIGRAANRDEKLDLLSAYRTLKDSWSAQRRINNEFGDAAVDSFYRILASDPHFVLWYIKVDDHVIGVSAGFQRARHFSMMIISSEQDLFAAYSPGDILVDFIMCDLCAAGFSSVDFGTGDAEYKRRWLPAPVELRDVIHPLTFSGQIAGAGLAAAHTVKAFIKARPQLTSLAHRLAFATSRLTAWR